MSKARGNRRAPVSARGLAATILREIEREEAFSNRVLATHLERHPDLDPRDRGFVTTLVYGVLRHRARLDLHIDAHAHTPGKLRGLIRELLRIGTFELLELGRPLGIVASEISKQVDAFDEQRSLRPVVHAILAGIDRDGPARDRAFAEGRPLDVLARRFSIPRWLAGKWIKQLGAEAAIARAQWLLDPPPLDLRVDLSRTTTDEVARRLREDHPGVELERVEDQPQALRATSGGDLFYGPLHAEGLVSVQGLGAQRAAIALAPQPGERILDACAGMGVKTLQLAELMQRRGHIVAADTDARQLAHMDELIARGALDAPELTLEAVCCDLTRHDPHVDQWRYPAILLDVPCTGLGNLARHPEIRWRRRFEDIEARAALQLELLLANLARLDDGGRLVYAVCSAEPEEGPAIVARACERGACTLESERTYTPETDGTEGFYVARVRRP